MTWSGYEFGEKINTKDENKLCDLISWFPYLGFVLSILLISITETPKRNEELSLSEVQRNQRFCSDN